MIDFAGQRVVITGGSSGIGKELARQWLGLGAHVTIVADAAPKLEAAAGELRRFSPSIDMAVCDIGDLEAVERMAEGYLARHGVPDVLVNNAGYAVYETFSALAPREIARLIQVNFAGACYVTRAFLPSMQTARRGHVVMMASIAGRLTMTPCGIYSASKHGMVAFAETLRAELESSSVHVHVICPGRVETDFFRHPTFVARAPRLEAERAVAVEDVATATIDAVIKRRFLTYRPRTYRFWAWAAQALPIVSRPLLQRLMRARVAALARPTPIPPEKNG